MVRCLHLLLLSLCLLLSGCLDFDAQEITFRYDSKLDRIDALVVYRGIYLDGGDSDKPMDKALLDLDEAMKKGEFFFWNNWPLHVDPTSDKGPGAFLLPHMEVETGGLFTDPKGILCGYQFVRIKEAKAFVQKINTLLEVGVQAALVAGYTYGGQNHKFDADTRDAVREFLRSGEKMLVVEPGRVELRMPCTRSDHRWLKDKVEHYMMLNMPHEILRKIAVAQRRAAGGDVTSTAVSDDAVTVPGAELASDITASPSFRFFWDNDLSIERTQELTTVGIGERGADQMVVTKASEGMYHEAFLKKLRERGDKIEDGLPPQELARRFEGFRGRDCVLPELLAAKRKGEAPKVEKK